jgi:hypothetical protein
VQRIKELYIAAKAAKVGESCICPSCATVFVKANYQQAFCKSRKGTKCKDLYWNRVTPEKFNNQTRLSPANLAWQAGRHSYSASQYPRTSEGYRIIDGVAYDDFDQPVYNVAYDDGGDSEYWDNSDNGHA